MRSYSQLGEDIYVFQNFINVIDPSLGVVCVEVGAYDGVRYSNTLMFQREFGAYCVLVEPSAVNFRKIVRKRSDASAYQVAAFSDFGVSTFAGHSPVGGMLSHMTKEYLDRWGIMSVEHYKVLSVPLSAIVEVEGLSYIDFLSIDVQGAELEVLSGMNWGCPVYCICIELEGVDKSKDDACRQFLLSKGFRLHSSLHINEFWVANDSPRRFRLFSDDNILRFESFEKMYMKSGWQQRLRSKFR